MPNPCFTEFLAAHPVFRREALKEYLATQPGKKGESDTVVRGLLDYQVRAGRLEKVRRGLYVSVDCLMDYPREVPYLIAAQMAPDAVIGYQAALHWHLGLPVPPKIQIHSRGLQIRKAEKERKQDIPVVVVRTARYPGPADGPEEGVVTINILGQPVRMTSLERSFVEVLHRPGLVHKFEEVWEKLGELLPTLDLESLRRQVCAMNCRATTAKVGYLVTGRADRFDESQDWQSLIEALPPIPQYPHPWSKQEAGTLETRWQLRVPEALRLTPPPDMTWVEKQRRPRLKPDYDLAELLEPSSTLLQRLLEEHFGPGKLSKFREKQEDLIRAVLEGKDALGILPTGAGKSLIYQLTSRVLNGPTLVVTPTIALMDDQVEEARAHGLRPFAFDAETRREKGSRGQPIHEEAPILGSLESLECQLQAGDIDLLFAAPEALPRLLREFPWLPGRLQQVVVDEAHLIYVWGSTFRKEYRKLGDLRTQFPGVPILALTGTARPRVREDIIRVLGFSGDLVERRVPSRRRRLFLSTLEVAPGYQSKIEPLVDFLFENAGRSGIVYCPTKREAGSVLDYLRAGFDEVRCYHAGMSRQERRDVHAWFRRCNTAIVVATTAFGLGVNKHDARFVAHFGMPSSIEAYAQEVGRAGRDGKGAECMLIFSRDDQKRYFGILGSQAKKVIKALDAGEGEDLLERLVDLEDQKSVLESICRLVEPRGCLHGKIASYFDDPKIDSCEACDRDLKIEKHRDNCSARDDPYNEDDWQPLDQDLDGFDWDSAMWEGQSYDPEAYW